ncbi:MAG: hypothetical protein R3A80_00870 [Bdellovibrionota bacterium]
MKSVSVETGGCNVQFAVNPTDGRRVVIENESSRVSFFCTASKATGFPPAYVATKLALGKSLVDVDGNQTKKRRGRI